MDVDLLLIDTGDLHQGTGLSDATTPDGDKSMPIFGQIDYDLMAMGKTDNKHFPVFFILDKTLDFSHLTQTFRFRKS